MKKKAAIHQIIELVEKFISRQDISIEAARSIEGIIATEFNNNELLNEFADSLAQYSPDGRNQLNDFETVKFQALEVLKELWNLDKLFSKHS